VKNYVTYPGYRSQAITWKDKGNFYLYGGQSKITDDEVDIEPNIWQFDPKAAKWHVIFIPNAPQTISEASACVDRSGALILSNGRKFNPATAQSYPTNQIWKIKLN
jgi:N-acetylneuraminic acid mutarotase